MRAISAARCPRHALQSRTGGPSAQAFLRRVNQLTGLGILLRRTTDEALLRQWEEEGTGVGAGFEARPGRPAPVHRSAHGGAGPQATEASRDARDSGDDPRSIPGRQHPQPADCSARWSRTPRCSTPICTRRTPSTPGASVPGSPGMPRHDRRGGRDPRGGHAAAAAADRPASVPRSTADFPAATASRWFALKMLDAVSQPAAEAPPTSRPDHRSASRSRTPQSRCLHRQLRRPDEDLNESPARLRSRPSNQCCSGLGLVRTCDDGWIVLPVAGRYRDPKAVWEPTLEDMTVTTLRSSRRGAYAAIAAKLPEPAARNGGSRCGPGW